MENGVQVLTATVKKARVRLPYTTTVPRLVPYHDPTGTEITFFQPKYQIRIYEYIPMMADTKTGLRGT